MHDKYMIPLIIFGTLVLVMFVFIVTSFLIIYKQRQRRHQLEKNELAYKYKNQLLQTRLEVEEHALKSISREIHDHVNQILGVVRMNLFYIPQAGSVEAANRYAEETNEMVREAIDHLRDMSHTLSGSGIKKMGLINAVRKELNNISQYSTIQCSLQADDVTDPDGYPDADPLGLSAEDEILVFRIIQESLANIVKHARASEVQIHMQQQEGSLRIDISDNGTGFQPVQPSDGMGLVNMHERAALLNGKLSIDSTPGKGCTITLILNQLKGGKTEDDHGTPENDQGSDY